MKILTAWLRQYLPVLDVDDAHLAEDLTLRGIAVEGVFELNDLAGDSEGARFDMDITTNRVDAMNHYGIAREAAAIYGLPLHPLDIHMPPPEPAPAFPVRIDAPEACGRFTVQIIRGITVAPSEGRTAQWFGELNQRSISNAVDPTNFVMLAMGQPTHAFDLDTLEGGIVVRYAHPGEQLKLLDGSTRNLVAEDLVVADERKALALAGVMGGWDSMITSATKNVLVEAAWFAPAGIRATSRRHAIHTDASHRFERGADFDAAPTANALVTQHILAAAGGRREGELIDIIIPARQTETVHRAAIPLSSKEVLRHLGTTIPGQALTDDLVARYLTALGCTLTSTGPDAFSVILPSWRLDLTRGIDLIEEVARVHGYNRFANTLPAPGIVLAHPLARAESAIRAKLLALGYSEAISSTFASPSESALFAPQTAAVLLENPLNDEASQLRPSLLPGMAAMLAGNLNRDVTAVRLFESGTRFTGSPAQVDESLTLTLGLTGALPQTGFVSPEDLPFYELKGVLESLLTLFTLPPVTYEANALPAFLEPGRAAALRLSGSTLAHLGQLSTAEQHRRKLRQPVFLAELDLAALLRFPLRQPTAGELSRFQAVERDFSFTFPDSVQWSSIEAAIRTLAVPELLTITPVEHWRDRAKFPGVFSTLIRTIFQSNARTLTDEKLARWQDTILAALKAIGGIHRA